MGGGGSRTNTEAELKGVGPEGREGKLGRDLEMRTGNPRLLRSKVHQGALVPVPYLFVALSKSLFLVK